MGLLKKVQRFVGSLSKPGPTEPGSDPYALMAWLLRDRTAPVVIDVGCNEGDSIATSLRLMPGARVHAFEPSPETAARCSARFNGDPRVTIHTMALGAEPGRLTLHRHTGGATDSLLADGQAFNTLTPQKLAVPQPEVEVAIETLDNMAQRLGLARIDLLKTDTQGFDDRVIAGAKGLFARGGVSIVYVELIYAPIYQGQALPHQVMATLTDAGFRMVGLFGAKHERGPVLAWCDAMFIHESLLKSQ